MSSFLNNPKVAALLVVGAGLAVGWPWIRGRVSRPPNAGGTPSSASAPQATTAAPARSPAVPASASGPVGAGAGVVNGGGPASRMDRALVRSRAERWILTPTSDPFRVEAMAAADLPAQVTRTNPVPVLSMVMRTRHGDVVMMNGRTLRAGEELMGYTLLQIEDSAVILRDVEGREIRVGFPWSRRAKPGASPP